MFRRLIQLSLLPLLISSLFADIIIDEGEVTHMTLTKWKGTWAAPGGKQLKYVKLKVTKWHQEYARKGDEKIIEALEAGDGILDVTIERYPISYSADTSDYKFLKKHRRFFTGKVSPKLSLTGHLLHGKIPSNSDKKEYILLRKPTFKSRKGVMSIPYYGDDYKTDQESAQERNFQAVYSSSSSPKAFKDLSSLSVEDFKGTVWKRKGYRLKFNDDGSTTLRVGFFKKYNSDADSVKIKEGSNPPRIIGTYHYLDVLDNGNCLLSTDPNDKFPEDCFRQVK